MFLWSDGMICSYVCICCGAPEHSFARASGLQRCFVHHGMNGATKPLWSWLRQPRLNTRGEGTSADNGSGSSAGTRRAALQSLPEGGEKHALAYAYASTR